MEFTSQELNENSDDHESLNALVCTNYQTILLSSEQIQCIYKSVQLTSRIAGMLQIVDMTFEHKRLIKYFNNFLVLQIPIRMNIFINAIKYYSYTVLQ
jgi:hypothetical protein